MEHKMHKRTFSLGLALLPFTAHRALAHGDAHKKPPPSEKSKNPGAWRVTPKR
jgi:hypothetical protein